MNVIFVGISNKSNSKGEMIPFDLSTPSGKIMAKVDLKLGFKSLKTNLVNHTPLDNKGKIRYPNTQEISIGIVEIQKYIDINSPCLVFMLGKIVEKSLSKELKTRDGLHLVAIKHPSYIHVYKKSTTDEYISNILDTVRKYNSDNNL